VPQFEVGHAERVARLDREVEKYQGLYLAGSALGAYGLADCVASGEAVAATICAGIA
jgi:oxygen-dependent protoporphyrinogen oxidase